MSVAVADRQRFEPSLSTPAGLGGFDGGRRFPGERDLTAHT